MSSDTSAPKGARSRGAPAIDISPESAEARADRIMEADAVERSRLTAVAVTGALLAISPLLILVVGFPDVFYYWGLTLLFVASVWGQRLSAMRHGPGTWRAYAFVAANFALLTFTLVYPNPFAEFRVPPAVMLRFGNFVYFFIMLAALAFSFAPSLVLWGGACAAVFWSIAHIWVALQPGVVLMGPNSHRPRSQGEYLDLLLQDMSIHRIDPGIWIQECAVILVVAAMLSQVVALSRRMARRQAGLERRSANLARYLPAQMADSMAEADKPFGEERKAEAAILFTDVIGFTGWAEGRDPAQVMRMLREVHALVAQEVFRAQGVLDKFIGDGTMATFGVAASAHGGPLPTQELAHRALACAEGIVAGLAQLNRDRLARGEEPVRLSIGLHVGMVVIGDVGAAGRMELATLGDAVNVASRLESLTREMPPAAEDHGREVAACASGAVMDAAGGAPEGWRLRGRHALPGRREAEVIWTRARDPQDPA